MRSKTSKNYKKNQIKKKKRNLRRTKKYKGGREVSREEIKENKIDAAKLSIMVKTNIPRNASIGPFKFNSVIKDYSGPDDIYFTRFVDLDDQNWSDYDLDSLRKSFTSPENLQNAVEPFSIPKNITDEYTKSQQEDLVQSNIAFIIRTLVPKNEIFYLNNQPYTIYASQWNGNWSIRKKSSNNDDLVEFKYNTYEINLYLHLIPGTTVPFYDTLKAYCNFRNKRIQDNIKEGTSSKTPVINIEKDLIKDKAKKDAYIRSATLNEMEKLKNKK